MSFMPRKPKGPTLTPDAMSSQAKPSPTYSLKDVQIRGLVPSHHTPIPEQRVSMDSRHPLTKQWHRRHGASGVTNIPLE
jgi:hypothetical protein